MKPVKEITRRYDGSIRNKKWCLNGKLHREDGPAAIYYREDGSVDDKVWYLNGELHREDGPAIVRYRKDGSIGQELWFIDNTPLSPEEIEELKLKLEIQKITELALVGEL